MTARTAGQRSLLGTDTQPDQPLRFTVSVLGRRRAWVSAFALAVAEARAAALSGRRPVVLASDGTAIEVVVNDAGHLAVRAAPLSNPSWADKARQLLADHG